MNLAVLAKSLILYFTVKNSGPAPGKLISHSSNRQGSLSNTNAMIAGIFIESPSLHRHLTAAT
jgi:hypothetical protein